MNWVAHRVEDERDIGAPDIQGVLALIEAMLGPEDVRYETLSTRGVEASTEEPASIETDLVVEVVEENRVDPAVVVASLDGSPDNPETE